MAIIDDLLKFFRDAIGGLFHFFKVIFTFLEKTLAWLGKNFTLIIVVVVAGFALYLLSKLFDSMGGGSQ